MLLQSPVSELTTPEDQTKQEGAGDPLTSPPPATSFPPDPSGGDRPDLFESCEEPSVGGFSSVPLEQPAEGGGTQQVSTDAKDPPPTPPTTPSVGSLVEIPLIVDTDQDLQPTTTTSSPSHPDFTLFDTLPNTSEALISSPDILSPPATSTTTSTPTTSAQELSASPPSSSALLDLSMTLPQELSSEPPANLVDAPSVEPAVMSSFITPAEEASTLDAAAATNDDDDDDGTNPTNLAGKDPALSSEEELVTVYDNETPDEHSSGQELDADSSLLNAPSFLGDGETTEISLDDTAQVWTLICAFPNG